jgi:hypothetical protein
MNKETGNSMRILCWSIGFFLLTCEIVARIFHPGKSDLPHNFFFIKYTVDIFIYNVVILMFILPFLFQKGIISSSYYDEDKSGQAKFKFVVFSIMLPGLLSVISAIIAVNFVNIVTAVPLLLFLYLYIESIFILNRKN